MATSLFAPRSFSSLGDHASCWQSSFDFSHIHPSHGIAHDGKFTTPSDASDDMSAAEKLLAALAASTTEDNQNEEVGDMIMEDGEAGDSSDSSLDTPSTSFSLPAEQQKEEGASNEVSYFTNPAYSSSTTSLGRLSSCYFTPPFASILENTLAPLSSSLQAQLSSQGRETSPPVQSYSLAPSASTSSGMMRSFSAPAYTQTEYDVLKAKWNEEAQAAPTSPLPSSELGMARTDSRQPASRTRPGMPRRATSGSIVYSSRKGKGRMPAPSSAATEEDANTATYSSTQEPVIQDTFSSRDHLLSPTKKSSPFKRSRLSYSTSYHAAIYEDPREDELATPPIPSYKGSDTTPTKATPPKSPTRPSFNRHFTSPEFWAGASAEIAMSS